MTEPRWSLIDAVTLQGVTGATLPDVYVRVHVAGAPGGDEAPAKLLVHIEDQALADRVNAILSRAADEPQLLTENAALLDAEHAVEGMKFRGRNANQPARDPGLRRMTAMGRKGRRFPSWSMASSGKDDTPLSPSGEGLKKDGSAHVRASSNPRASLSAWLARRVSASLSTMTRGGTR